MNEKTAKVRRQYDREFKADTVRLVTEGGHRPTEVAREVGITTKMLGQWRRQLEGHSTPEQAFVGQGHDREAEVKQLKRRITILEMERDILKKPSASSWSQNGNQEDALRPDFSVSQRERALAFEGAVPCCGRFAQWAFRAVDTRSMVAVKSRLYRANTRSASKRMLHCYSTSALRIAGVGVIRAVLVFTMTCANKASAPGIRTSRKRVARLMKQNGLVGRSRAPRRVTTTDSRHAYPVAHNLLERRFAPGEVERPNRFWCGDITYLPTNEGWAYEGWAYEGWAYEGWAYEGWAYEGWAYEGWAYEGWAYLATVKDVFSRRIVGWALGETLEATLVEVAWKRALHTRGFASHQGPELYHSDRGSQYASHRFQDLLITSGTQASMSRKGECLDNAVAESFFGTLKAELLGDQIGERFESKRQALH